jgi:hypothetical protein
MRNVRLVIVGLTVFAVSGLPCHSLGTDERAAVPPAGELAKAEGLIKQLFKSEYAKTKAADRLALAAKLLEQGTETKDDPAARYVLFREASDIAARAGDPVLAMRALDELTAKFEVKAGEARIALAGVIVAGATTANSAAAATETLLAAADDARAGNDWPTNVALAKAAETASRKAGNTGLATSARARLKEAEMLQAEADKAKEHFATLKTSPDDETANLAVGRFYCLLKQDWDAGIACLVKGSDAMLKAAAEKDARAQSGTEVDKMSAGDAWYDLANPLAGDVKPALQVRAHYWYTRSVADLSGLTKTRVEKRIAEIQSIVNARSDNMRSWTAIRKAIADNRLKRWEIITGNFTNDTYEEIPKDGGILIGFHYTTTHQGRYPGVLQAIYQTSRGEIKGKMFGAPEKGEKLLTTKAKAGYAVGAIYTRGAVSFDMVKPIYMKIAGNGLNVNDKYDGPRIGGETGNEGTFGGDGQFIIGLHGKLEKNRNDHMAAISPVTVHDKEGASKSK